MKRLLTRRMLAGRKKTKRRRRKFLFIVIQFLTNRAAMLDSEGRLNVFFFPGDFFKS